MKNFIKKFKFLLLALFLLLCLVACNDNPSGPVDNPDTPDIPDTPVTPDDPDTPKVKEYFTVSFDTRCELPLSELKVLKGSKITTPATLEREGYTFVNWTYNDEVWDFENNSVTSDIKLVAMWKLNSYTLTLKYNNGNEDYKKTYSYNVKIAELEVPTKTGYTFIGWTSEGKVVNKPETMPAHDVTLEAGWKINTYTITVKYNDGVNSDAVYEKNYNEDIEKLGTPKREGYEFTGWDKTLPNKMPAEDIVVTAKWTVGTFTLTIKDYYGAGNDYTISKKANEKLVIANPTCAGYKFAGYYTKANLAGNKVELDRMYTSDYTIYAGWNIAQYKVTYILNDGKLDKDLIYEFNINSSEYVLPTLTKKGYVFRSWYCDNLPIEKIDSSLDKDVTLVAKFDKIVTCSGAGTNQSVTLTFNEKELTPYGEIDTNIFIITGDYRKVDAGNYTTYVTPKDGYCWNDGSTETKAILWEVIPVVVNVFWSDTIVTYNGGMQTPKAIFMANGEEYALTHTFNERPVDAGDYTVSLSTVSGYKLDVIENYVFQNTSTSFTIEKAQLTSCTLANNEITYNRKVMTPTISTVKSDELFVGNSYELAGDVEVTSIGSYNLKVKGTGNFTGTINVPYTVVKGVSLIKTTSSEAHIYLQSTTVDLSQFVVDDLTPTSWTLTGEYIGISVSITGNTLTVNSFTDDSKALYLTVTEEGNENISSGSATMKLTIEKTPIQVYADQFKEIKFDERFDLNGLNIEVVPLSDSEELVLPTSYDFFIGGGSRDITITDSVIKGVSVSNSLNYYYINVPSTINCKGALIERSIKVAPKKVIYDARLEGNNYNDNISVKSTCNEPVEYKWYYYTSNIEDTSHLYVFGTSDKSNVINLHSLCMNNNYFDTPETTLINKRLYCDIIPKNSNYATETVVVDKVVADDLMNTESEVFSNVVFISKMNVRDQVFSYISNGDVATKSTYNNNKVMISFKTTGSAHIFMAYEYRIEGFYRVAATEFDVTVLANPGFSYVDGCLSSVRNYDGTYCIPEYAYSFSEYQQITGIFGNAFKGYTITKVVIPNAITVINNNAFIDFTGNIYFETDHNTINSRFNNIGDWGLDSTKVNVYFLENGEYVNTYTIDNGRFANLN